MFILFNGIPNFRFCPSPSYNQGENKRNSQFGKTWKTDACMHQTKIVASKMFSQRRGFELWAASRKSPHPPWEILAHNCVHNHAQNGELVLLYKTIQETQEAAIGLMKSIKGPQIQRHERPRNVCKRTFSLQSILWSLWKQRKPSQEKQGWGEKQLKAFKSWEEFCATHVWFMGRRFCHLGGL